MSDYARGSLAWGLCQRCGLRTLLKFLVLDGYYPNIRVCSQCYDAPQPQERLAVVSDPVALWKPAPDAYYVNPPFLTAAIAAGAVVLTWTSIGGPPVGSDHVGGQSAELSAGYIVQRLIPGEATYYFVLLLHFDGANGQTTTVDSSTANNPVTVNAGGGALSTAVAKFGPSSLLFTSFQPPAAVTVNFVSGSALDCFGNPNGFTISAWVNPISYGDSGFGFPVFNFNNLLTSGGCYLQLTDLLAGNFQIDLANYGFFAAGNTGNQTFNVTIAPGTWHNIAFVCTAGGTYIYWDGIAVLGPLPWTPSTYQASAAGTALKLFIGAINGQDAGYMDEFAIAPYALYTSNFVPPTQPFGQIALQEGVWETLATLVNTADEFGALSIETLTYTDGAPPANVLDYRVIGYDVLQNAEYG